MKIMQVQKDRKRSDIADAKQRNKIFAGQKKCKEIRKVMQSGEKVYP